jgi:hypothetical protein
VADHGITAFVLKYRILETPADEKALTTMMLPELLAWMQSRGLLEHAP